VLPLLVVDRGYRRSPKQPAVLLTDHAGDGPSLTLSSRETDRALDTVAMTAERGSTDRHQGARPPFQSWRTRAENGDATWYDRRV